MFDFDTGACGSSSFFADVYTSHRMTLQIYDCGGNGADNFWAVGDGQFHTYTFVVAARGTQAYRDGVSLAQQADCTGVPVASRTGGCSNGLGCVAATLTAGRCCEQPCTSGARRATPGSTRPTWSSPGSGCGTVSAKTIWHSHSHRESF